MIKNRPASVGDTEDTGSSPGWGRSPGGGSWSICVLVLYILFTHMIFNMYYQHDWQVILQFRLSTKWHTLNKKINTFYSCIFIFKLFVTQECIKINLTFHSFRGLIHSLPMNKNWEHITRFFKNNFYWCIFGFYCVAN